MIKKDELKVTFEIRVNSIYIYIYIYIFIYYIDICGLVDLIGLVLACLVFLAALHPKVSIYTFISHLKFNLCNSTRPF